MRKSSLVPLQIQLISFFFPCKIDAAGDKLQLSKEGKGMEREHDPSQKIVLVLVCKRQT